MGVQTHQTFRPTLVFCMLGGMLGEMLGEMLGAFDRGFRRHRNFTHSFKPGAIIKELVTKRRT